MVMIVNKTVRVLNIGGTVVTPGMPVDIDKSFLDNERIKEMMEAGELEESDGSQPQPSDPATEQQPEVNQTAPKP